MKLFNLLKSNEGLKNQDIKTRVKERIKEILAQKTRNNEPIMINIGCGLDIRDGWLNVDYFGNEYPAKEIDNINSASCIEYDINKDLPFDNDSVDVIYSSHFFEHLTPSVAMLTFAESYRALKPGGLFRICLPDVVTAIKKWVNEDHEYFEMVDNSKRVMMPIEGKPNRVDFLNYFIYQNYEHKMIYSPEKVVDILEFVGFKEVHVSTFNSDYDIDLEVRKKYSFYVEGIK